MRGHPLKPQDAITTGCLKGKRWQEMFSRARNVSACGSHDEEGRPQGVLTVARGGCYEAALLRGVFRMDSCCLPLVMEGLASFERMALSRRACIDDGAVQQHSR